MAWAIAQGTRTKQCERNAYRAPGFMDFTLSGPLNRVQCLAADAAKEYRVVTQDSVAGVLWPVLIVRAGPDPNTYAGNPTVLLLKLKGDSLIRPDSTAFHEDHWTNRYGAAITTVSLTAFFALERWPTQDFTVVAVAGGEEYKVKLGQRERGAIH